MPSWTDGYVTDIPYTSGFYRELSPVYLSYLCDIIGVRAPDLSKPYNYCELGCGQGFGSSLLAAANPLGSFYAYDFNPAQIANAQALAAAGGLKNIQFFERSFQELAAEPPHAEPMFDVIVFHGIISWIMPEHFQHIITFVERRLKPGGLVYVSYNSLPGWAAMAPAQRLMREFAKRQNGRSDQKLEMAMAACAALKEAGAGYFSVNASVGAKLEKLAGLNKNYLAHEYLNEAWVLFYFADIARELERAKLTFAGTATLFENFDHLTIPEKLRPLVAQAPDPIQAQTLRDFAVNQQFRRDLFVRGHNALPQAEQLARLRATTFQLLEPVPPSPLKFKATLGEVTGNEERYRPVTEALAAKPMPLGEILALPELDGVSFGDVSMVLSMLVGGSLAHPAQEMGKREFTSAMALNQAVARKVLAGADYAFLSAPAVGSAVPASFMDMCLVLALAGRSGKPKLPEVVDGVWRLLEQSGRRLVKEGVTLQGREESLPEIERNAAAFLEGKHAFWKALGVL